MQKTLLKAAQAVLDKAYVKYSNFPVAAALLCDDGTIITGVNIENASYGLTNCAERTALFTAYTQGYRKDNLKEILITTSKDHLVSPCGACRQVLSELMPKEALVHMHYGNTITTVTNEELLPLAFSEEDL